jgi:predicted  nucleic acid-binding Zn-ribbon protein
VRISAEERTAKENRIRAVIDRLLRGDVPAGGRCDIKTLAREARVDRTAFYGSRPYAHLRVEFEQRLGDLEDTGVRPNRRDTEITRLKDEVSALRERLAQSAKKLDQLTDFRAQALSRLAAQHDEISRLRDSASARSAITRLPRRSSTSDSVAETVTPAQEGEL